MAKITAPVKNFSGIRVGVQFTKGVAETDDPRAIAFFSRSGYKVEHDAEPVTLSQPFPDGTPDKSWKSAELKHYAAAHEIDIKGASNKDEILAAIDAATDAPSDENTEK